MMLLEIQKDTDITKLSTLRVVAKAELFFAPKTIDELRAVFVEIKQHNWAWNILGAGSNTLLSSRGIPGIIISTNNLDFINKIDESQYEVGAGLRMPRFCAIVSRESLTGAEFMEGIPGSIGGGIVMNAGAHGSEIAHILVSAKVLDLETLELQDWSKEKLAFSYRHSGINPQKHFVVSAVFKFTKDDKEKIRERVMENNHARTSNQPIKSWTCGCTFKNPLSTYGAGKLIDDLGLKGYKYGDFMISNLHGNFFENIGQGTSIDFCKLMEYVQEQAMSQKGLKLIPEVQPMGIFSEEEQKIWS